MDTTTAKTTSNYTVDQGIGNPVGVVIISTKEVRLAFGSAFDQGIWYTLEVSGITDCPGNTVAAHESGKFIIPFPIQPGDLIINEILFNPASGGVDYLEIYNLSNKTIDLAGLEIIEVDPASNLVTDDAIVSGTIYIDPGAYNAFTSNKSVVLEQYYTPNPDGVIAISGFPNWADDEGIVRIQLDSVHLLDELHYFADWHFPLIDDQNGVSLERLRPYEPTQDENNWASAASTVDYGTPAYENSQLDRGDITEGSVEVDPEIFSPDGDGYNDQLFIRYQFGQTNLVATIRIFDEAGRLTRLLANNDLLSESGTYTWDGTNENGDRVRLGIYFIHVEVFDLNGSVSVYKRKCVVAGRL